MAGLVPRRQEKYTMEHVAALGNYTREWELFKDGYVDGKRVYERDIGLTCHQCRQKTLGKRTRCSKCQQRRGQVCGDCLWMRYGENVEESLLNLEWTCPVCRDICNCSFCRTKNGLAPTGTMYNWAKSKGFKSVAHYLIMTFQDACEVSHICATVSVHLDNALCNLGAMFFQFDFQNNAYSNCLRLFRIDLPLTPIFRTTGNMYLARNKHCVETDQLCVLIVSRVTKCDTCQRNQARERSWRGKGEPSPCCILLGNIYDSSETCGIFTSCQEDFCDLMMTSVRKYKGKLSDC